MSENPFSETFNDFKNSFYYGSRSDMNFKFLHNLPAEDAAQFIQDHFALLGRALDDGDWSRVTDHLINAQARAYAGAGRYPYEEGPFAPLSAPLSDLRLGLLTSSGHFVTGDDPRPFDMENMTQEEAEAMIDDFLKIEPGLSTIPADTPLSALRVRHGGYDVHGAQTDPNVNFPIQRLAELQAEGRIGALHDPLYSFVGACAQTRLLKHSGPAWVEQFKQQNIDALLLVPV